MKRAVFPGSFDPITRGHESIIRRGLELFDEIVVAIGTNSAKHYLFDITRRQEMIEQVFNGEKRIRLMTYTGLTVEFCRKEEIRFILRGLRSSPDFEFERAIAQMNRDLAPEIETIMLNCDPRYTAINSTIVRDIYLNGGDVTQFLPPGLSLK